MRTNNEMPPGSIDRVPKVIDLFAGCGGLSLGFSTSGFDVLLSIDSWEAAVRTHAMNLDHPVVQCVVEPDIDLPDADVIVGGPPCQGFSSAGLRKSQDYRNNLVKTFAELVAEKRPDAFVFENVEGFLTTDGGRYVHDLLGPVVEAGYAVHVRKVNAANYGAGQLRKRVIVVGGRSWVPTFPAHTHSTFGAPGAGLANGHLLPLSPTFGNRTDDLPPALPWGRDDDDPIDHTFAPFGTTDAARAALLGQGQCMRDLPEEHWHGSYARRANRRVQDGTPTERRGGAPAGLRRLRHDEPSKAITGGALREFVHPIADRPLTIRECARLQDFPDNFRFHGTRAERIQQIGNAVPISLARALARSLLVDLREQRPEGVAGIVSFVPTLSVGMSPALRRTTNEVASRYRSVETERQGVLCL